jgi:hypothetical protein
MPFYSSTFVLSGVRRYLQPTDPKAELSNELTALQCIYLVSIITFRMLALLLTIVISLGYRAVRPDVTLSQFASRRHRVLDLVSANSSEASSRT